MARLPGDSEDKGMVEECLAWVSTAPDWQALGFTSLLRAVSAEESEPTHHSCRSTDPHGLEKSKTPYPSQSCL